MINPVVQLEPTGCGIASVATIAGLSYAQAKAIASSLDISAQDARLWSETAHVHKLLEHLGVKTGRAEHPFRSWEALPDLAILSVKWHLEKGRPFWHWVVFVRDDRGARVLDPKKRVCDATSEPISGALSRSGLFRSLMPDNALQGPRRKRRAAERER